MTDTNTNTNTGTCKTTSSPIPDTGGILDAALTLALLDGEVWRIQPAEAPGQDQTQDSGPPDAGQRASGHQLPRQGQMWNSDDLLRESGLDNERLRPLLENIFGRANQGKAFGSVLGADNDRHWAQAASDDLHGFVHGALRKAMALTAEIDTEGLVTDRPERRAGAIYLYNDRADELVMAASEGFPLRNDVVHVERQGDRNTVYVQEAGASRIALPDGADAQPALRGIFRLDHLRKNVAPILREAPIARSGWVDGELRTSCDIGKMLPEDFTFDCNRILVGTAFYRTGGAGITAQLFDREQGPELERGYLAEENYRTCVADEFKIKAQGFRGRFLKHLQDHLLEERTLVFKLRSDMGAGRKDTAGLYEGLQFPAADWIGPFLGTVLRFNGEHLGILKVERWCLRWLESSGEQPPDSFSPVATARFLVYAYVLAGALYVLKHHYGVDLSRAWNGCSRKTEGTP